MINAPSVALQRKNCITSFLNAPTHKSFGKHSPLGGLNLLRKQNSVTLKDIILRLLNRSDVINYLIILRKLCIWECRKAGIYPHFNIFLKKVKIMFETEKYIANKNGTFASFRKRWEAILAKLL